MNHIFEIIDKSGKRSRLTNKQWKHIQVDHPDVSNEEIKQTLQKPLKILKGKNKKYFYYQYFKNKKSPAKFLRVIVKYLNGDGFVITAYFVKNLN